MFYQHFSRYMILYFIIMMKLKTDLPLRILKAKRKMKRTPIFPKSESGYCHADGFDARMDFSVFLEEARKHASQTELKALAPFSNQALKNASLDEKKSKKSWKSSLFFWSKSKKRIKPQDDVRTTEPQSGTHVPNLTRRAVSGPIYGSDEQAGPTRRGGRPTSGPLAGFLTPRRGDFETPYMSLDQLNNPTHVQSFGPIYLVK
ncbi:uncharacterized protein LOC143880853 [Tasmannia lanceolata]|uniref:uncharacterized protein LOC143880853 n=1 Tax=Tasmannia lanceolata TaxID=3420 RepID=UPI0040634B39